MNNIYLDDNFHINKNRIPYNELQTEICINDLNIVFNKLEEIQKDITIKKIKYLEACLEQLDMELAQLEK